MEGDLIEEAGVTGNGIAATFVEETEPPKLVEAVAPFIMEAASPALVEVVAGMTVGCAVLIIPARLSVTLTLSQSCMAKELTSERCQ